MLNFLFNNSGKLKNNFEAYPDALAYLDEEGKIICNNTKFHSLFAINDNYEYVNNINLLIPNVMLQIKETATTPPYTNILKYTLADDVAYFEISANYDVRNKLYVVAFRDITNNEKKKIELVESFEIHKKLNKNKNDFLIKITPDLTSPIQSIFGFSQALLEGLGGELNEKQLKYIKIIWKNSKELGDLSDKILLLSKIEAGNFPYDYKVIDFINVLKQVKNDFKQFFEDRHLSFDIDFSELQKRQCFADEKALKIILANFVESSLTNTDLGGIKITVKHPTKELLEEKEYTVSEETPLTNFIQFTISDTGNGFSPEEFNTLFNPYEEIEVGNKKNLTRSLGLAIAKNFVENLNGKLWGTTAPMEGCEFNFIIPTNSEN